jgi:hypothetical protein
VDNWLFRIADNRNPASLAGRLRQRRMQWLADLLRGLPRPVTILDVGGTELFWKNVGLAGDQDYRITLHNRRPQPVSFANLTSITGDARDLGAYPDGAGMSTTLRDKVLDSVTFYFGYNTASGKRQEPFQHLSLREMRYVALDVLHEDMEGYEDAMAAALAEGDNLITFTIPVHTGYIAAIEEAEFFGGMGPSQARTVELTLKQTGEPLTTLDDNLALTGLSIDFNPRTRKVSGDQWCNVVEYRKVSEAKKDTVSGRDGTPLSADDVDDALDDTELERITVKVDDATPGEDTTPARIVKDYEKRRGSDENATAVKSVRTPVFRALPGPLIRAMTGVLSLKQVDHVKDWDTRVAIVPAHTEAEIVSFIEASAALLKDGDALLAVNTLMLEGISLNHNHLHLGGFRTFRKEERQFNLYPGRKCTKDGNAVVYIPEHMLREKAPAWARAKAAGRTDLVESIERSVASWIPGAAPGGRGFKGDESQAMRDVASYFARYLVAMQARAAQQQPNKGMKKAA